MKIEIKYDGKWPCLCMGHLTVVIDGKEWDFGKYVLISGGSVVRNDEGDFDVSEGPWSIKEWPKGFPEDLKETVIEKVNEEIRPGCCGGCI